MKIEIAEVSTKPTPDMHQNGQEPSTTELWIDPKQRKAGISQVDKTNSIPIEEYLGLVITRSLENAWGELWRPKEGATKEYLNGEQGQELLCMVVEGWTTEWYRDNIHGCLTEEANNALESLLMEIDNLPHIQWHYWNIEDYLDQWLQEGGPITTKTTSEELKKMAAELEAEAVKENVVFDEDILEYLERYQKESFLSDE